LRNAQAGGKTYQVKAQITIEELGMTHEVTGQIKAGE